MMTAELGFVWLVVGAVGAVGGVAWGLPAVLVGGVFTCMYLQRKLAR